LNNVGEVPLAAHFSQKALCALTDGELGERSHAMKYFDGTQRLPTLRQRICQRDSVLGCCHCVEERAGKLLGARKCPRPDQGIDHLADVVRLEATDFLARDPAHEVEATSPRVKVDEALDPVGPQALPVAGSFEDLDGDLLVSARLLDGGTAMSVERRQRPGRDERLAGALRPILSQEAPCHKLGRLPLGLLASGSLYSHSRKHLGFDRPTLREKKLSVLQPNGETKPRLVFVTPAFDPFHHRVRRDSPEDRREGRASNDNQARHRDAGGDRCSDGQGGGGPRRSDGRAQEMPTIEGGYREQV
jgi:hypothetical protein